MRQGHRAGRSTVVVYIAVAGNARSMAGFAVSRAVGGAVVRNRVKRRLRAICLDILPGIPEGSAVVVRALPPAATATFAQLSEDVRGATERALSRAVA